MFALKFPALVLATFLFLLTGLPGIAQTADDLRATTGGAQTLEDILARQRGEVVDDQFRQDAIGNPDQAAPLTGQLGTLGGIADPEFWRAFRYGSADIISTDLSPAGNVVIQDGGMRWLNWRNGPIRTYGGYLLLAVIVGLAGFYAIRGKILIEGEKTGETVLRFRLIERLAHWTMAIPFVILAVTGLSLLFGRIALIPLFGKDIFMPIAGIGKLVHHYIAWAFMFGVILSFILWAWKNLPAKVDFKWLIVAGGMFKKGVHPSAGKFNAGEKILFWMVMFFGVIISLTGLSLLFPYQISFLTPVLEAANSLGLPSLLGIAPFDTVLAPQEEMQYANLLHTIIAFVYMAVIIAHIYLGSIGMEGALPSMTKGRVETQWAKEHHDLWYEEVMAKPAKEAPAE
ncbi:MAG: formate dehydrogenase subunit gamma [Rhodobacteraceae bacterium]|nr:MAG: formate dehydrogenase subunit gamma [Paracoccaceae bacterium]